MRKNIILFITVGILLSVLGCGDGGSSSETSSVDDGSSGVESITLQRDVKTEVFAGDVYEAGSDDARITYEQNLTTDQKYITLTAGNATLLREVNE